MRDEPIARPTCETCPNWMRQNADQGICVWRPAQMVAMPVTVGHALDQHGRAVEQQQFMPVGSQPPMKAEQVCAQHPDWPAWVEADGPKRTNDAVLHASKVNGKGRIIGAG